MARAPDALGDGGGEERSGTLEWEPLRKQEPPLAPLGHPARWPTPLLRRADWRFLLGAGGDGPITRLALLGAPEGLAQQLAELGLARSIAEQLEGARSADGLAVLEAADVSLAQIADCLRPGGALYWEIDGGRSPFRRNTTGAIHRALEAVGLTLTGLYCPRPGFSRCQLYLPLDRPEAIRWYLETSLAAGGVLRRTFSMVLREWLRLSGRSPAFLWRRFALTAVAGASAPAPLLEAAASRCGDSAKDLRVLLFCRGGSDPNRRLIVLPFARGRREPVAVLKFWRLPERNRFTEREQEVLRAVRRETEVALWAAIPEPLGLITVGPLAVGIESYLPGPLLSASSARSRSAPLRAIRDIRLLGEWLCEFHRRSALGRLSWDGEAQQRWVEAPLAAYAAAFGMTAEEERLFREARRRSDALRGADLPLVWSHKDLAVGNVCRSGQRIGILDWAWAAPGLPLVDLFFFVMSYLSRAARDDARILRFRQVFAHAPGGGPLVSAVRSTIRRYTSGLGLDPGFPALLLVLTWVIRANAHHRKAERLAGEEGLFDESNFPAAYLRALASEADRIFAPAAASARRARE